MLSYGMHARCIEACTHDLASAICEYVEQCFVGGAMSGTWTVDLIKQVSVKPKIDVGLQSNVYLYCDG